VRFCLRVSRRGRRGSRLGRPSFLAVSGGLFALVLSSAWAQGAESSFSGGSPTRGANVAALAGGCGCHTETVGPLLAGGKALVTPAGTFYSTNITSDLVYGVGAWTDGEVEQAIRAGLLRNGESESPAMPYYRFSGMSDRDVRDLIAWLRTIPAAAVPNREHETWIPAERLVWRIWRALFAPRVEAPEHVPQDSEDRGRYLTEHVSICGDCHTPRTVFGAEDRHLRMAGANDVGETAPNITPDRETGIGEWDLADIVAALEMGMLPNMDNVQGLMADVVDGVAGGPGYAAANPEDLLAIAAYVQTLPAIRNSPE